MDQRIGIIAVIVAARVARRRACRAQRGRSAASVPVAIAVDVVVQGLVQLTNGGALVVPVGDAPHGLVARTNLIVGIAEPVAVLVEVPQGLPGCRGVCVIGQMVAVLVGVTCIADLLGCRADERVRIVAVGRRGSMAWWGACGAEIGGCRAAESIAIVVDEVGDRVTQRNTLGTAVKRVRGIPSWLAARDARHRRVSKPVAIGVAPERGPVGRVVVSIRGVVVAVVVRADRSAELDGAGIPRRIGVRAVVIVVNVRCSWRITCERGGTGTEAVTVAVDEPGVLASRAWVIVVGEAVAVLVSIAWVAHLMPGGIRMCACVVAVGALGDVSSGLRACEQ